jgi:hypothetical protein
VSVNVSTGSNGNVAQGFAGFSYEKEVVGADMFDPANTSLVALFKLLGPSSLRIGGNTVDLDSWSPGGAGGKAGTTSQADVDKLAAFLQETGWTTMYGVRLKGGSASSAAAEATYVASKLGSSLQCFEIGNEPDFYTTTSGYESSFNSFYSAITSAVPGAKFDGPGASDHNPGWASPFASNEKSKLLMVSTHMYIGDGASGSMSSMLGSTGGGGKLGSAASAIQSGKSAGVQLGRISETNSFFHGGTAGVSNSQGAALWSLDYMYLAASHNNDGINFHGGTSTQFPLHYSPIQFSGIHPTGVQGVFMGELLWSMAGTGPLHSASVSGGSSVTAWGIGNNVIVVNEGSSAIAATITLPASATSVLEYIETAGSISATSGFTIAGSGVSATGAFNPSPYTYPVTGNKVVVGVPGGSAALVVSH